MGVQLVAERVDSELAADGKHLRRECLVQLDDLDVVDRHLRLSEYLAHRFDRPDAHDLRSDTRDGGSDDSRERHDSELSRARVTHNDDRGGAVVQGAGVAGRHLSTRLERRLELGQPLERGVRARSVVLRDTVPGSDLPLEEPSCLRRDGSFLGLLGKAVHVLAGDVPLLGDVLRRQTHWDIDVRNGCVVTEQLRVQLLGVLGIAIHLGDRFDAGGDVRVALAGANRMERHADRLQARGAETVHGRSWHGLR